MLLLRAASYGSVNTVSRVSEGPEHHVVFRGARGSSPYVYHPEKPQIFLLTLKLGVCFSVGCPVRHYMSWTTSPDASAKISGHLETPLRGPEKQWFLFFDVEITLI